MPTARSCVISDCISKVREQDWLLTEANRLTHSFPAMLTIGSAGQSMVADSGRKPPLQPICQPHKNNPHRPALFIFFQKQILKEWRGRIC